MLFCCWDLLHCALPLDFTKALRQNSFHVTVMWLISADKAALTTMIWSQHWPTDITLLGDNHRGAAAEFVAVFRNGMAEWFWNVNKLTGGPMWFSFLFFSRWFVSPFCFCVSVRGFCWERDLEMNCVKYGTGFEARGLKITTFDSQTNISRSTIHEFSIIWIINSEILLPNYRVRHSLRTTDLGRQNLLLLSCMLQSGRWRLGKPIPAISGLLLSCHFTLYTQWWQGAWRVEGG